MPIAFDVLIFGRYGEAVFKSKGVNRGWDGYCKSTPAAPGTYVYIISIKNSREVDMLKRGTMILTL
jgi:gliding motility-associated-like protein